jgi:hypothetical protein
MSALPSEVARSPAKAGSVINIKQRPPQREGVVSHITCRRPRTVVFSSWTWPSSKNSVTPPASPSAKSVSPGANSAAPSRTAPPGLRPHSRQAPHSRFRDGTGMLSCHCMAPLLWRKPWKLCKSYHTRTPASIVKFLARIACTRSRPIFLDNILYRAAETPTNCLERARGSTESERLQSFCSAGVIIAPGLLRQLLTLFPR